MPSLQFLTLDVFTSEKFKGNPLAVCLVPTDHNLPTERMQIIAREFNLSETVFIHHQQQTQQTSTSAFLQWHIRIFTASAELPFAGHPTIGAAWHLLSTLTPPRDADIAKAQLHCQAGVINISLTPNGATAQIPHAFHLHSEEAFTLARVKELQPDLPPQSIRAVDVVSPVRGMNFVVVELADLEALAAVSVTGVKPCPSLDRDWNVGFAGSAFYVITSKDEQEGEGRWKCRTRMIEGVFEDPATGSMSCGLAALLTLRAKVRKGNFDLTQAVEMGRQSDIGVEVELTQDLSRIETMRLTGRAVKVMEGTVEY